MKKRFVLILLAILLLSGCGPLQEKTEKIQIVATIFPLYDFAREIAGEDAEVKMLLKPGAEVHSYEPTPQDIIAIQNCDVFLYIGGESDEWVRNVLSSVDTSRMQVLTLMDCVDAAEEAESGFAWSGEDGHDHDHDGHDHGDAEYDEHIWTSPVEAEKLCRAICDALCAADPAHAADFQANLAAYLQELSDLDADFRQVCREKKRDLLVFGDRFPLLYFCREYGLNYRAAFHGCSSDTEPSLYTLKFLIDKVRQEQIPVVYALELSSQKVAEAIAETTEAKVVTFYSCQTVSQSDWAAGEGYLSLMRRNVAALREGIC